MTSDTILARSFSRTEQTKFRYGAILLSFFIALSFFSMLKTCYLRLLPSLNLDLSTGDGQQFLEEEKSPSYEQEEALKGDNVNATEKSKLMCSIGKTSDYCVINADIRIHSNSSSIFITFPQVETSGNSFWSIRPYARKEDGQAMSNVREWTIWPSTGNRAIAPQCTHNHRVPAVLFSTGGYSGNDFHAFSDIIVPLYLTSKKFNGEVQFLVTDKNKNPLWIDKFRVILENLSHYELIDIDLEQDIIIHCFPGIIVGLEHHEPLIIDPTRSPYSMEDFKEFLRNSYSLKRTSAVQIITRDNERRPRPRLLIVSRKQTRTFVNAAEIKTMAEDLGYEVVVGNAVWNTMRNAEIVNSCDVMMGVHGAGLTNFLFLPKNAVLIQIIPIGGMEIHGKVCFGEPAKIMNLSYIEYRIKDHESSLVRQYPIDHVVFKDPAAFHKGRWSILKSVYLEKQNVELDLNRFRGTLVKAMELLHS